MRTAEVTINGRTARIQAENEEQLRQAVLKLQSQSQSSPTWPGAADAPPDAAPEEPGFISSLLSKLGQGAMDVGKGALKGAGQLAVGAGEAVRSTGGAIGDALDFPPPDEEGVLTPFVGRGDAPMSDRIKQRQGDFGLSTEGGGFAEKVGEFGAKSVPYMVGGPAAGMGKLGKAGFEALRGGAVATLEGATPGEAGVAGAAQAALPPAIQASINKLLRPAAKSIKPDVVEAAQELGLDLPASAISSSRIVQWFEHAFTRGFGGGKSASRIKTALDKMETIADDIVAGAKDVASRDVGGAVKSNIGIRLVEGLEKFDAGRRAVKAAMYSEVGAQLAKARVKVELPNTAAFVKEIAGKKSRANTFFASNIATDSKFWSSFLKNTLTGKDKLTPVSAPVAMDALEELGSRAFPKRASGEVSTGDTARLQRLWHTMSDELESALATQNPKLGKALTAANTYYKETLSKVNSVYGKAISRLGDAKQYDQIADAVFHPSMSVDDIPRIFETLGQTARGDVQAAVVGRILARARDSEGGLKSKGLQNQVHEWGRDKLAAILEPEQYKKLLSLAKVDASMDAARKAASPGHQWSAMARLGALGGIGALVFQPHFALSLIVGDVISGRMAGSAMGQKLMGKGFEKAAQASAKSGVRKALAGGTAGVLRETRSEGGGPDSAPDEDSRY